MTIFIGGEISSCTGCRFGRPCRGIADPTLQPDDVADLVDEQRVIRQLEGLAAMGLQAELAADAVDRRPTDPTGFGHVAHARVGSAARRRFQRANHDLLDLLIGDRAGRARIRQSLLFYFTVY